MWIEIAPVVAFKNGDRSPENVVAVEAVIRSVVRKVIQKSPKRVSLEVAQDVESEALCVFFDHIDRDYVDFDRHSPFNYIYTLARNALTNVSRKEGREYRLGDMSEAAEEYLLATTAAKSSLADPLTGLLIDDLRDMYDRLRARAGLLGHRLRPFVEQLELGYDYDQKSLSSEALLVASFRCLFRKALRW